MRIRHFCGFLPALFFSAGLAAQAPPDLFVYPAQGQSAEQTRNDKAACHEWAAGQVGFDPAYPARPGPPAAEPTGPGMVGGAVRGALVGTVGGAIAGDLGKGAAIGAATGALFGGIHRHDQTAAQQQWTQQQQAYQQQQRAQFDRAMRACLEARGYSVS